MPMDLSKHARTLVEQYQLVDGVFQMRVRATSPLVGLMPGAVGLDACPGLDLIGLQAGDTGRPLTGAAISEGDTLLLRGESDAAALLAADKHLAFAHADGDSILFNRTSGLAEVVIPPRSAMVGQKVFPGMVTESGDLIILAVQRRGENLQAGLAVLEVGDTMLLQGTWTALD
jgi:di/tricarboxylate transporter